MELGNYRFRGRRPDGKRWLYGDLYHAGDLVCICDWSVHPQTVENFAVDPTTVGCYLGLQDKNGNDIWGGVTSLKMMFCGMSEPSSEFPGLCFRV